MYVNKKIKKHYNTKSFNIQKNFTLPVPNPPNPVVLVVTGLFPNVPKPVFVPKPVEAVFAVPNPLNKLGVDVVVVVPNPPKPPKLNVDVVAVPKPTKPDVVQTGVPNVEVVPNPVVAEEAEVLPKAGAEPKALGCAVPKVGADPKPVLGAVPKPVAAGVPNPVLVPNPVVCVDGVPNKLGVEVVGVLNPNEGVPKPAT